MRMDTRSSGLSRRQALSSTVALNGVDVSGQCIAASEEDGWCDLFPMRQGKIVEPRTAVRHHGVVVIGLSESAGVQARRLYSEYLYSCGWESVLSYL